MSYDPAGPSNPVVATRIEWVRHGSQFFTDTLDRVPDPGFVLDSLLQGWTRAHVAGHLARNADALLNLLTWARTGHETPMYGSAADRIAGINTAAARPASEIRQDVIASNARLASALELLPDLVSKQCYTVATITNLIECAEIFYENFKFFSSWLATCLLNIFRLSYKY